MAGKDVIWSERASQERIEILRYWIMRNASKAYSVKLNQLFAEATKMIGLYPRMGRPTSEPSIRIKFVKEYGVLYKELDSHIEIVTVWDGRRDLDIE
jgi:plasmid stabilization system protein ParE